MFAVIAFVNCEVDCERCPYNYDPVCAIKKSDGTKATFGNLCAFDLYNCMNGDGNNLFIFIYLIIHFTLFLFYRIWILIGRGMPTEQITNKPNHTL